jgi:transcriptional regulator with XRE-family HTH domain
MVRRSTEHVSARSSAHVAFARAIRELREASGTSQEAFAMKCGIDRGYYGGIERGKTNPSLTTVLKIAEALGVAPSEIHAHAERLLERDRLPGARGRRAPSK